MEVTGMYMFHCDWEAFGPFPLQTTPSVATDVIFPATRVWAYPLLQEISTVGHEDRPYWTANADIDYWLSPSSGPGGYFNADTHVGSVYVYEDNCCGVAFYMEVANCSARMMATIYLLA
jgi:hypothetical protein